MLGRPAGLSPELAAWAAAVAAALALAGCERAPAPAPPTAASPPAAPARTGVASYYGPEFAGETTASGEPHDPRDLTAASRSLPLGTTAKVTNLETGKSVAVEVNDRGPYAKNRILDLSRRAAVRLGMIEDGVAKVKVQPLRGPPGREAGSERRGGG